MNTPRQHAASYLLYAFAMLWPLEVFGYLPGLNVNATDVIALILVLLMVYDSFRGERLRVPFEILWPTTLLLILVTVVFLRSVTDLPLHTPAVIGLFAATIHFARSRAAIEHWLLASVWSGAVVSALTLMTPIAGQLGIVPTAYSLSTGATLTFARDLYSGIQMLILWGLIGVFLIGGAPRHTWTRRLTVSAVLLNTACLVQVTFREFSTGVELALPRYMDNPGTMLAVLCLVLWLTARVAAKVEVSRRESPAGLHAIFLAMIATMAVWAALFPSTPKLFQAYLLGLACAYVIPNKGGAPSLPLPKIALATAMVLTYLNLTSVHPEHQADPRNYEIAAQSDFENGRFDILRARMNHFAPPRYTERRTHLWLARAALAEDRHDEASFEFRLAMAMPEGRQLLAGPSENEQKDFLVRLRDHCSSLPNPEATVAYERACLAAGDMTATLESLRLRVRAPGIEVTDVDPVPLAAALAFILGDHSPAWAFDDTPDQVSNAGSQVFDSLLSWPASSLLTVLAQLGVEISRAPGGFPSEQLPLVLVAERGGRLPVVLGRTRAAGLSAQADALQIAASAGPAGAAWSALALDDQERWVAGLLSTGVGDPTLLVRVAIDSEGTFRVDWTGGPAYAPAARIWLP